MSSQPLSSFSLASPLPSSSLSPFASQNQVPYLADVLPARRFVSLFPTTDEFHYIMQVLYGGQGLRLIIDTIGGDLVVLDQKYCQETPSHGRCFFSGASNLTSADSYLFGMDLELLHDSASRRLVENFSLTFNSLGSTRPSQLTSRGLRGRVLSGLMIGGYPGDLHRFEEPDGLIGLGLARLIENITTSPEERVFALDLAGYGQESVMWLGGINEAYRERMSWGSLGVDSRIRAFPISSFEVCGTELLTAEHSYIQVDTKSACLTLPELMFDTLVPLLPLHCESRKLVAGVICTVPAEVPLHLPTVSFTPAGGGDVFVFSLDDLIIRTSRQLCIRRAPQVKAILLGTRCLRSLFVAFNYNAVGFSNKLPALKRSNVQCAAKMQCKGMQEVCATYNMCMDPACSNYYFYQFDSVTKVCFFNGTFHTLAAMFLTFFVIVEFVLQELELYLEREVIKSYPLSAVA